MKKTELKLPDSLWWPIFKLWEWEELLLLFGQLLSFKIDFFTKTLDLRMRDYFYDKMASLVHLHEELSKKPQRTIQGACIFQASRPAALS